MIQREDKPNYPLIPGILPQTIRAYQISYEAKGRSVALVGDKTLH